MRAAKSIRRRPDILFAAYVTGLWVTFYLYVLLRVRPQLFYHQDPTIFLLDWYYFSGFWDHAGGPIEYVSAFLSPLFAFGWLGAAVVTVLAALICQATRWWIAATTGTDSRFVFLIPAIPIVMVLGQYSHPVRLCVGLPAILVLANVLVRVGVGHPAPRLITFMMISALVYYVAAGLYVIFALVCGFFEWAVRRQRWLGALYVLCAAAVPIAMGTWLFDSTVVGAFRGRASLSSQYWLAMPSSLPMTMTIRNGLLLFFPVVTLILARRSRVADTPAASSETQGPSENHREEAHSAKSSEQSLPVALSATTKAADALDPPTSWARLAIPVVALVVLGVGADFAAFDSSTRCLLQMADSAEHRRWADVLAYARQLPRSDAQAADVRTVFQVNRALFFSGNLLDGMFCYVQVPNTPTLALRFNDPVVQARMVPLESGSVLFDLGRINESEHMTYEALEVFGERPQTLKRLIYIQVLKGRPEAARRFLALLERSLLHGRWARNMLRRLDTDPRLASVPLVASRRELMLVQDSDGSLDLETMLEELLERNPRNRMAFEYLMAHYLLTRRLDKIVANLDRIHESSDPRLPQHCEEALAIHLDTTGLPKSKLSGHKIRPETRQRYREFVERLNQFRGNAPAAFAALYPDFGDTYFFYYAFGHNDLSYAQSMSPR